MSTYTFIWDGELQNKKIGQCVTDVMTIKNCRRATAYMSAKLTIKATAQRRQDKRAKSSTILVTIGRPNFIERRFIKVCQKAGMAFPLRQIQWKFWPKKKPEKRVRLPRMKVSAMRPISARATTTAV